MFTTNSGRFISYYGRAHTLDIQRQDRNTSTISGYYGAAEPPVRCGESHLSGLTEPPQFVY